MKKVKPENPASAGVKSDKPAISVEMLHRALMKARISDKPAKTYRYPIQPPQLMRGITRKGVTPAVAMDSISYSRAYDYARSIEGSEADWVGFPGYPYLAGLSTRAEYRMFAQSYGTSLTREWITLNSTETAGKSTSDKCTELMQMITDLGLKDVIETMAEHDSFYGRSQMLLNIGNQDKSIPLILSNKTIEQKNLKAGVSFEKYFRVSAVEALWTTPTAYNSIDPGAPDFYRPRGWWMLGQEVHATRLPTIITRPVSDMLKPAFNFGGMSMSQLAEPYVDNWLRTRQSVSDLVNNFSIVALSTAMEQILQGDDDGTGLHDRAELFTLMRSNKGVWLLDKEREQLDMLNTPLSGLSELQAQAQEGMCSVSHTPAVVLLGIAPSGFGNVAEGEVRTYYDWIAAEQEGKWRRLIERVLQILQLIRYGEIDPDIVLTFQPLYQMTPKELSEIRKADAERDATYTDAGILDPVEVRERIARDPESGYQGIDTGKVPGVNPDEEDDDAGTPENGEEEEANEIPS